MIQNQWRKEKMFSNKISPTTQFTIEIAQVRPIFGRKFDVMVNIWE